MKFNTALLALGTIRGALAGVAADRDPTPAKVESIPSKYFQDLGSKRVKITYGPFEVPGSEDPATDGMVSFHDMNAMMPCHDCIITGFVSDLRFLDGKTANAKQNIWLHHTGLMNLNRTDLACEHWPERIGVNGNERSPFDFTLKGTRKAGYYLRKGDEIFQTVDIMNLLPQMQTVNLVIEWEFLEGTPANFDIVFPVWLDVKGNCLNETRFPAPTEKVFTAKGGAGWTSKLTADLLLMVPHIHDGNTKQEIYLNGQLACTSVPAYGETSDFITHVDPEDGHGHDHGASGEHIYHVSSISQCSNVAKVVPGSQFTIASWYDFEKHVAQKDHHGELEPIMAIEFLYLARPQEEAIKDILAMKGGDLQAFQDQVRGNNDKKEPAGP